MHPFAYPPSERGYLAESENSILFSMSSYGFHSFLSFLPPSAPGAVIKAMPIMYIHVFALKL